MPIYDYKCKDCGLVKMDIYLKINDYYDKKCFCGGDMERVCNCSHFKLKYNNKTDKCAWSDQNYESSQYYRYTNNKK